MKKLTLCLGALSLLLILSSCTRAPEEKIVTVDKVIKPTIAVAPMPRPLKLKEADILVVTETNFEEVVQKIKEQTGGVFVLYALDPQSFENLALNFEELKRYIEQQKEIILYYEKAIE